MIPLSQRHAYPNLGTPPKLTEFPIEEWKAMEKKINLYSRVYPNKKPEDAIRQYARGWDKESISRFREWMRAQEEKKKLPTIASEQKGTNMENQKKDIERIAYTPRTELSFDDLKKSVKNKIKQCWEILNTLVSMPLIQLEQAEKAKAILHNLDMQTDKINLEAELHGRVVQAAVELRQTTATEVADKLQEVFPTIRTAQLADNANRTQSLNFAIQKLTDILGSIKSYRVPLDLSQIAGILSEYTEVSLDILMSDIASITQTNKAVANHLNPLLLQLMTMRGKEDAVAAGQGPQADNLFRGREDVAKAEQAENRAEEIAEKV